MKKNNYYVIGGQYRAYCYGGTPTLLGAKRLANRCCEYWDNWQGWHTPGIYCVEDTTVVYDDFYGYDMRIPICGRQPIDWTTGLPAVDDY